METKTQSIEFLSLNLKTGTILLKKKLSSTTANILSFEVPAEIPADIFHKMFGSDIFKLIASQLSSEYNCLRKNPSRLSDYIKNPEKEILSVLAQYLPGFSVEANTGNQAQRKIKFKNKIKRELLEREKEKAVIAVEPATTIPSGRWIVKGQGRSASLMITVDGNDVHVGGIFIFKENDTEAKKWQTVIVPEGGMFGEFDMKSHFRELAKKFVEDTYNER